MARPEKVAAVAEIQRDFASSEAIILTEYRGLTVKQMSRLRRSLAKEGARYKVVKMTLARRAAAEAGLDGIMELLAGPTAIVFCETDPIGPAKSLEAFRKEAEVLLVKGGVLGGDVLSAEQVVELSRLESREMLLARLAGVFQAPLARMAALLAAMPTQMAGLVKALADTKPAEAAPEPGPAATVEAEAEASPPPTNDATAGVAPTGVAPEATTETAEPKGGAETDPAAETDAEESAETVPNGEGEA